MSKPDQQDLKQRSYEAWGVIVETGNVRGAHLANGIVQLLRVLPDAPDWTDERGEILASKTYVGAVEQALDERFDGWRLSDVERALCVTGFKRGTIDLRHDRGTPSEAATQRDKQLFKEVRKIAEAGRRHLSQCLSGGLQALTPEVHRAIADVLNADDRVKVSQASDPTTPGFRFTGFSSPHTLSGMHAATFLGLLSATERGADCLVRLYNAVRGENLEPQNSLVHLLGVGSSESCESVCVADASLAYPLPSGGDWGEWANLAGKMTQRLLDWASEGTSMGAEILMGVVDLASLLLSLRMLRWRGGNSDAGKLLLVVSASQRSPRNRSTIERAQVSLNGLAAGLDDAAAEADIILTKERKSRDEKPRHYYPSKHALNLAASGGWLRPREARGGAKRYFAPGSRQLSTLVRALVNPSEDLTWSEFAARAETLGLAFGGLQEHSIAKRLHMLGGAATVRDAGGINKEHLISLGLARRESDDVVRIDGGGW